MPPHHLAWASPDKVVYGLVTPLSGRSRVLDEAVGVEEPVSGPVLTRRQLWPVTPTPAETGAVAAPGTAEEAVAVVVLVRAVLVGSGRTPTSGSATSMAAATSAATSTVGEVSGEDRSGDGARG